jgi:hypothetical protein
MISPLDIAVMAATLVGLFQLFSNYRKLHGTDPESLQFQKKISDRVEKSKALSSLRDLKLILILGISSGILLLIILTIRIFRK